MGWTISGFETYANIAIVSLSTITLCSLYRTLLHVLHHSSWELAYSLSPAYLRSTYSSSEYQWLYRPFPGFWSCKRGIILWRPPARSNATEKRSLIMNLPRTNGTGLVDLTKVYWHFLSGRGSAIMPRYPCVQNSDTNASPCVVDCQKRHVASRPWVWLLRKDACLFEFLMTRHPARKAWRAELFRETMEIAGACSALQTVLNLRILALRNILGMKETGTPEYRDEDRLCLQMKAYEPPLGQATCNRPERWPEKNIESFSSQMWSIFASSIALMLRIVRLLGFCDPPLEEGKVRVRWRCVRSCSESMNSFTYLSEQRCGRRMYDDFIECQSGAAKKLEGLLNHHPTADSSASRYQRSATSSIGFVTSSEAGTQNQHLANANTPLQSPSQSYEPIAHRRIGTSTVINCSPESRWLLVCARVRGYPTSLSQLDVRSTVSDKELFQELRASYLNLKSKWVQKFSLKRVQHIRFVQVRITMIVKAATD